ncbi:MAG TPA: NAD(P)(+) transhydrogenase (Re/Si-specific) subunit beta [Actinomycetota bacterium]|nr:NAD(P)(+) transhydrogenase (Re/Si-specific) subunit beta [Actinomycetota bacterium]
MVAGVLFVLALKWLSSPPTARRGVLAGEIGFVLAVVATLLRSEIITYQWILIGLFIGTAIGIPLGLFVPMTAMPQRIALSHAFGALAAALVGIAEFYLRTPHISASTMTAIGIEVVLGSLTFTGSLMAAGKLQEILPGRPITWRAQNVINLSILGVALAIVVVLVTDPSLKGLFPVMVALSLVFGVLLIVPIGGADMPTVIALLNSYAGLSGAAMGFAIDNKILIVAGALDGASGFLLAVIMARAMNRSFRNVMFGAFGKLQTEAGAVVEGNVISATPDEAVEILKIARLVIICPGYGMAVAQAQHMVRQLSDALGDKGVEVKFAIHPVAGRMPGHMNVLLAEANVPYDQLFDMDQINAEFPRADVALVVGANDVVNPAAKNTPGSPIYGMPVLNVEEAQTIMVIKRSMAPGFAGIDNELFVNPKTTMIFGDAKQVVGQLVEELTRSRATL